MFVFILCSSFVQSAFFKTENGNIRFSSKADLEIINATSKKMTGLIDPAQKQFAIQIDIETFSGFNSELQRQHFYEKYMEVNTYPQASFEGKIIEDVNFTASGNYLIRAKGILNIHGVEQERIIQVNLRIEKNKLSASSSFSVPLADHNIKVPQIIKDKLASEIQVDVEADFYSI